MVIITLFLLKTHTAPYKTVICHLSPLNQIIDENKNRSRFVLIGKNEELKDQTSLSSFGGR